VPSCQVTVNGQALALHDFSRELLACLNWRNPPRIVVHTDFDVRWVDIRPKSSGIAAVIGPITTPCDSASARPFP